MAPSDSQQISMLLKAWGNGDPAALERLTPLVYAELHRMARRHMRKERETTLQTTALVHEAYLRLVDAKGLAWALEDFFTWWGGQSPCVQT